MSVWKQLLISLIVLAAAAGAWVKFFPGSHAVLASWGMDWAIAATGPEKTAAVKPDAGDGQQQAGNANQSREGGGNRRNGGPNVVTAQVTDSTINDRLTAIGTGRASNSVVVTPYSSGRLTEIAVKPGDRVEKGSLIARMDADTEQIAVDRARVALDDARSKLERMQALKNTNTATTVQVRDAQVVAENAELALRDAELALERRSIISPIGGIVGIIQVEAGNAVVESTQITTVDDRSRIIIDFWVPERYAGVIDVGAPLTATPIARPKEMFDGTVSALDNRVDEQSRTLQVRAVIPNPDDTLRAGMSFQVAMKFPGDTYPSVNPLAVQWGTDGAFVWAIKDGKAKRTPVRIIQRNTDSVLVEGDLASDDLVVTEGIHTVREGADIQVASRGQGGQAPAAGGS